MTNDKWQMKKMTNNKWQMPNDKWKMTNDKSDKWQITTWSGIIDRVYYEIKGTMKRPCTFQNTGVQIIKQHANPFSCLIVNFEQKLSLVRWRRIGALKFLGCMSSWSSSCTSRKTATLTRKNTREKLVEYLIIFKGQFSRLLESTIE